MILHSILEDRELLGEVVKAMEAACKVSSNLTRLLDGCKTLHNGAQTCVAKAFQTGNQAGTF